MNEEIKPLVNLPRRNPQLIPAELFPVMRSQVRMAAVTAAASAWRSNHPEGGGDINSLLSLATKIEDWILRD